MMGAVSESESRVLEPHIPSGEQLIDAHTSDRQTVAVTDRRVIELEHHQDDRGQDTSLTSVLLTSDYVVGTEYGRSEDTENPIGEWVLAGILATLGIFGLIFGITDSTGFSLISGVTLLVIAAAIFYFAQTRTSGEVSATVRRAGDLPDRSWSFPQGEAAVARAISEQVAKLNEPK
ncbi:hypothetical protein [Haloarcula sp. Atlit-47R]|uniref:hypothetical protein n=1 Tax=Haloarcula sp. Atlit-47R TaxID=2282132 RepID=UPI0011C47CFA|nr:hypothetical protein [Haloarcula sp. Atlit-47R]